MRKFLLCLLLLSLVSCYNNEPRRPINHSTQDFYKELIEQNKKLNAREKNFIEKVIAKDTIHNYAESSSGFWYFYDKKSAVQGKTPKSEDVVTIKYEIFDIFDEIIYQEELKTIKVDKENLIEGMMEGIKLMKEQEIVTFVIPSYRAYGVLGDENKIGVNQPIKVKINLINIK